MNLSAIQKLIYVGPVFNKIAINQIPVSGNQMVNCLVFVLSLWNHFVWLLGFQEYLTHIICHLFKALSFGDLALD